MEKFETTVNRLNSGELLKRDGKWKCHDLKGVGAVCGISFPSLCCFVGLGKTPYAVQMAKQSPVNTKPGSYFGKLRTKLEITADDGNPSDQSQFYFSLWKAVGKSIGENVATIENAVCGLLRATKRTDNFVKGQDIYTLKEGSTNVFVKKYNSDKWEKLELATEAGLSNGNEQSRSSQSGSCSRRSVNDLSLIHI